MPHAVKKNMGEEGLFRPELAGRRRFIKLSACAPAGLAAMNPAEAFGGETPLVITEQAQGMIVGDPSLCVGCLRCELACTEFNDGKTDPQLARIKVARNSKFGPGGPSGEKIWAFTATV